MLLYLSFCLCFVLFFIKLISAAELQSNGQKSWLYPLILFPARDLALRPLSFRDFTSRSFHLVNYLCICPRFLLFDPWFLFSKPFWDIFLINSYLLQFNSDLSVLWCVRFVLTSPTHPCCCLQVFGSVSVLFLISLYLCVCVGDCLRRGAAQAWVWIWSKRARARDLRAAGVCARRQVVLPPWPRFCPNNLYISVITACTA